MLDSIDTGDMNHYWLTIHWPHPVESDSDHDWFIYFQDRYKTKGESVSPGDMVVFYETRSGKAHKRNGELVRLKKGRRAVVATARVNGSIRKSTARQTVREYRDNEQLNWAWEVPCDPPIEGTPIPLEQVLEILKKKGIRIRGGLIKIDKSQFEDFQRRLKQ